MSSGNGGEPGRGSSRRSRGRSTAAASAKISKDFWGSPDNLPPAQTVKVNTDPSALLRSLGRAPFSGREAISEYYLRAVYDNTVKLAEVLATAGDLLAPDPESD